MPSFSVLFNSDIDSTSRIPVHRHKRVGIKNTIVCLNAGEFIVLRVFVCFCVSLCVQLNVASASPATAPLKTELRHPLKYFHAQNLSRKYTHLHTNQEQIHRENGEENDEDNDNDDYGNVNTMMIVNEFKRQSHLLFNHFSV